MVAGCRIELFGGFRVLQGERTITRFRTQKTAALLAFLAYHRDRVHPRETLVEMLWPWASPAAGRQSLSQALSSLRHQLEPPGLPTGAVLVADHVNVQLNPQAVTTDLLEFEAALRAAERATDKVAKEREFEEAVRLYRGELLPGLYEPWIPAEQVRLSEEFVGVVVRLAKLLAERGAVPTAISYLRQAIETEPLQEEPYRELIRRLMERGEHGAAIKAYHELEHILEEELGERPSASAVKLAREVERQAREQPGLAVTTVLAAPPASRRIRHAKLPSGIVTTLLVRTDREVGDAGPGVDRLLHEEVRRQGGVEIEAESSALAAAFVHAGDALNCAATCQLRAVTPTATSPEPPARLTMAIHTADLAVGPDGRYPAGSLLRAERLLGAAHHGQILCSEASAGLVRYDLNGGLSLRDLGVHRLRGAAASERVFQLDFPGSADPFPPLNAESGFASHLPVRLTRFFGRRGEIEQLHAMLRSDARLVTVIGPPGCGKTRLAIEVAAGLQEAFHGAVWFVPLADLREGEVLDRALDSLGIRHSPHATPLDQIAAAIGEEPAVIVFDNFEHLTERAGELRALLERLPHLRCLVTSRRRLGLVGERMFEVQPLPVPEGPASLPDLLQNESVELFVDRAQAVKPDFQLTTGNAAAVVQICQWLQGVPLAIELAAARSHLLGLSQILKRIEKGEDLVSHSRDEEAHHRSLKATIQWSYDLLTPDIQRFFRRLSVFCGGWTAEAAEVVCEEPMAIDYLSELSECSLIVVRGNQVEPRFDILDMIRHFVQEQLGAEEGVRCRTRHFEHFHQRAEAVATLQDEHAYLYVVQADLGNFIAAMSWLSAEDEYIEDQMCIACSLKSYWRTRDIVLGRKVHADLLKRCGARASSFRAKAANDSGLLAWMQGDYASARSLLEEALAVSRAIGRRDLLAGPIANLANLAHAHGDYPTARSLLEEAASLNREFKNRSWEAINLNNLGAIALDCGDYPAARSWFEAALVIHREMGNRRSYAVTLGNLGEVAVGQGAHASARRALEESLAVHRELDDKDGVASGLAALVGLHIRAGDWCAAGAGLTEALALVGEFELKGRGEVVLSHAAWLACETSDGTIAFSLPLTERERAARLEGAAEGLREALSSHIPPGEREAHETFVAALRACLGDRAFAAAWESGLAMTFEAAVAYAREGLEVASDGEGRDVADANARASTS